MSVRKASKREIQKEERRATASKPIYTAEPTVAKEPVAETKPEPKVKTKAFRTFSETLKQSKFPKKTRFPKRKIDK